jgi:arylsulfatase A
MTRRNFLRSTLAAAAQTGAARPNVLIFLVDDMGLADIGPYGVTDTKTPHLDRLAKEGVRFTNSYSNGPVCTPTRCGLMTGRYQQRYGLEWAILPTQRKEGLQNTVPTLPRVLKTAGYRTAMFGKWHLGFDPQHGPVAHGFDEFFGILGGNVDHYTHRNVNGTPDLWEGTEPVQRKGYLTDLLTERSVHYLNDSPKDRPFFLYVPYNAVHWPFQPPNQPDERTRETWFQGSRADYIRMVESIDASVGAILGALEKNGFAKNTLVVFTNDNGGERLSRNTPAFHHKATLWEGGIRVPTLMRWPGRIPAGSVSDQPMITMDIAATVCGATGTKLDTEGIDLMPVITRTKPPVERTLFWRIDRADRKQKSVRRGSLKYIHDGGNIEMLFDLSKDPSERQDIAVDRPKELAELRALVAAWEADLAKTPPPYVVK